MNIEQFEQSIRTLFPKELLEEFNDDFGFTHKADKVIAKVGYSTNLSLEVIEQAKSKGVDLLITHHDAWDFIYGLREACVQKLKEYEMSHFWIHGPLDFVEFGTCTSLMNKIGVDRIEQYSYYEGGEFPGIGEFEEPIDFNHLTERIRSKLNEPVRAWRNNDNQVKRVGMLTGAGHSSAIIKLALDEGCDTYITGEATLYTIQYAQFTGVNLLVGSHTFTEIYGVESLANKVRKLNEGIEIIRIEEAHFELNHS
ncbi:Nif3-like dinuclear metal center hexameric protein [Planococcus sp. N028]|uniref:GTP cyclohydrolase 1 type 2 homolog n=1 Tax=Planococcus shixiaomingii TaxID=3058393 RepID=A0ABT8N583_9BACL|nr:Nif3-like dinuclear metal center hexameric protein [Planococcus sp. N028]MDN7243046.1 Nif3-like dinuclear metal center hexameric protein [Planococcus sp. N028]